MNPIAGMAQNFVKNAVGNNPFLSVLSAMKNGGNPMPIIQNIAQRDPRMAQGLKMIQGKSATELETMARNMCAERNVSVEQVAQSLGFQIPQGK